MERKKTAFSKLFDIVDGIENVVLVIMVIGMVVTIMIQIIGRIIGHPSPWTEETSRYLFLWMMFVALAAGFNQAESSRVTLLIEKGPNWLKKFSEVLYAVVVVGFFGFMIVYGWQVVQQQIMMNEMGTALKIPMSIIGICQPVAGVLGIIGVLQSFLEYHGKVAITGQKKRRLKGVKNNEYEYCVIDIVPGIYVSWSSYCGFTGSCFCNLYGDDVGSSTFYGGTVNVYINEQFYHGCSSAVYSLRFVNG